ncbi:esterase/lipase family protein [Streptomyces sp. NPDC020192]|uniref:esterase/lipase family protein n=1 Tax=Streptomyces sp. NPDC020192 TaxID=3365066 RepID=UPI0037B1E2BD
MSVRRKISATAMAFALGVGGLAATASTAQAQPARPTVRAATVAASTAAEQTAQLAAAPPRQDSAARPVIFVHGINGLANTNCAAKWKNAMQAIKGSGWRGELVTFGYYNRDRNCTFQHPGTLNTPLETIGLDLAWDIYNHYTLRGMPVDIIAHSMGGLITRYALDAVAKHVHGAPPKLYVEDVATLGTPHDGANQRYTDLCKFKLQCRQMAPGSDFLKSLGRNPQSAMGTDWTLIGSGDDKYVPLPSAIDLAHSNWGHKVEYPWFDGLSHTDLWQQSKGKYAQLYWNFYDKHWHRTTGPAPLTVAKNGIYWWWRW